MIHKEFCQINKFIGLCYSMLEKTKQTKTRENTHTLFYRCCHSDTFPTSGFSNNTTELHIQTPELITNSV